MSFTEAKIVGIGVDASKYHANKGERGKPDYVMSPSSIKAGMSCWSRWVLGYEPPDSEAKDFGNLIDCRLLCPHQFDSKYAVIPEKYTAKVMQCPKCKGVSDSMKCRKCGEDRIPVDIEKDWNFNATECQEWKQKNEGKEAVDWIRVVEADTVINRMMRDEIICAWHEACDKQVHVTGIWEDKATGLKIPVECLIDYAPRKDSEFAMCLGDLKTTRNAGLNQFQRWCYTAGYHIQAAFDLDLYRAATGEDRNSWCFLLCENYRPWETGKRLLSQDFIQIGQQTYQHALKQYAKCLKSGIWPSYDDHADAVQGWSLVEPLPFMAFEALSESMQSAQSEAMSGDDVMP